MILKVKSISKIEGEVKAPPSKSYSHRGVILASVSSGISRLYDVLLSEDTLATINACRILGATITQKKDYLEVIGTGGKLHNVSSKAIDLANSGTTLRLLTSIASLSDNQVVLTGDKSLQSRPMGILIRSLKSLGADVYSANNDNNAPIIINPGYKGGETNVSGSISSQFISSILISAPLSEIGVSLIVLPQFKSKPYVNMTIDVMEKFGVTVNNVQYVKHEDCSKKVKSCEIFHYKIEPQKYNSCDYFVEGDYSSASYLLGAVAILGGNLKVNNLLKDSKQGDKFILEILIKMGANINISNDFVEISSSGKLSGIEVDLSDSPDLLITVAVLGALAKGTTKITGVKHAKLKETNRITTTVSELKKLNCDIEELDDGMIIKGGISSGTVDSHKDHRLAMAFSLLALKYNVNILNGDVFNVSFPNFIETMSEIGIDLELR